MSQLRHKTKKKSSFSFFLIVFLLLCGAGGYAYITWFEGEKPLVTIDNLPQYIGKSTLLSFTISDAKSGLRTLSIVLIQKGKEKEVLSKEYQKPGKNGSGGTNKEEISISLDTKALKLKEGEATLKITVTDYSMREMLQGNSTEILHTVTIDTKPPKIAIIHSERYIKPGGAGIVIYRAEDAIKHGVMFNNVYHPGFPLTDGSDEKFISYIALQYSDREISQSVIIAEDSAGNSTRKHFAPVLQKPNQKKDKINISDGFLKRKIPEFEEHYPEMTGELVDKYLYSNRDIRQMNNKKIHDLCMNPGEKRLWAGKFIRMAGSGRAGFADHRTYYYKGEAIDKQVHLGMDIASTKHAPIKASGAGTVVFDEYLGIYGNMVMLDHGQGVFSLYSHLSQINVAIGDILAKGDILGNSGISGMAGGDHLHFSMLVNGIFVTLKEWWDQHWIDVTIDGPLVDAKF